MGPGLLIEVSMASRTCTPPDVAQASVSGDDAALIGGVAVAARAGPGVAAVAVAGVGPASEGLGPVVSSAQRREVVGMGLPRRPAVVHLDVGVHVVEVAVASGSDGWRSSGR